MYGNITSHRTLIVPVMLPSFSGRAHSNTFVSLFAHNTVILVESDYIKQLDIIKYRTYKTSLIRKQVRMLGKGFSVIFRLEVSITFLHTV